MVTEVNPFFFFFFTFHLIGSFVLCFYGMAHHGKENWDWQAVFLKTIPQINPKSMKSPKIYLTNKKNTPGLFIFKQEECTNMISNLESSLTILISEFHVGNLDCPETFYCLDIYF